jgi:hypothetical protein
MATLEGGKSGEKDVPADPKDKRLKFRNREFE